MSVAGSAILMATSFQVLTTSGCSQDIVVRKRAEQRKREDEEERPRLPARPCGEANGEDAQAGVNRGAERAQHTNGRFLFCGRWLHTFRITEYVTAFVNVHTEQPNAYPPWVMMAGT